MTRFPRLTGCVSGALMVALTACAPARADEPAVNPAKPVVRPAPVWQMVIAPKHGPAVLANFHPEADGSLTVEHRLVAPNETIGGPDAGPAAPSESAPLPAPVDGPALSKPMASRSSAAVITPLPRAIRHISVEGESGPVINALAPTEDGPALAPVPSEGEADPPTRNTSEPQTPAPAVLPRPTAETAPATPTAADKPANPQPTSESVQTPAVAAPWTGSPGYQPTYADIYFSIPFLRTEYDANPSYRHEATMEILFGQLRPTVIHKHVPPPIVHRSGWNYVTPYRYWNGRGYTNYNFYYPRPSVYTNY